MLWILKRQEHPSPLHPSINGQDGPWPKRHPTPIHDRTITIRRPSHLSLTLTQDGGAAHRARWHTRRSKAIHGPAALFPTPITNTRSTGDCKRKEGGLTDCRGVESTRPQAVRPAADPGTPATISRAPTFDPPRRAREQHHQAPVMPTDPDPNHQRRRHPVGHTTPQFHSLSPYGVEHTARTDQ